MAARKAKSRKGSAASSGSAPRPEPVFFIDKCLGLKIVPDALRQAGARVELKEAHFDKDTQDAVWLAEVGQRGWIVLSKDKSLRHNYIELVALLKSNTHAFILTSGSFTGEEMAQAFVAALPEMQGIVSSHSPPLVATVSKSGRVS